MREDFHDDWDGPEIEMTATERDVRLKTINDSLTKAREEIKAGKGIPADIVIKKIRARFSEKLKAET